MRKIIVFFLIGILLLTGCSRPKEAEEIVRLHIIANSDSQLDQEVKLKVRDSVLATMRAWNTVENKEDAFQCIEENKEVFEEIANQVLQQENAGYTAVAEVGSYPFPAKQYGSAWYPAGEYDALKVTLGEGKGRNWWCVMFPPLCLMDVSFANEQELKEIGKAALLMEDMPVISYESQLLEWIRGLFGGK
ncbi:MAG: stage II sporulation protein R [Christensenellales bacterium]